jgi:hypothetical protein
MAPPLVVDLVADVVNIIHGIILIRAAAYHGYARHPHTRQAQAVGAAIAAESMHAGTLRAAIYICNGTAIMY